MSMDEEIRLKKFDREMMKSMFVSLFSAVIKDRKRTGKYTMKMLADSLGGENKKFEVSRWFSGTPNWTLNTIADLSNALDLEISIEARDRKSGVIYTPQGIKNESRTSVSEGCAYAEVITTHSIGGGWPTGKSNIRFKQLPIEAKAA